MKQETESSAEQFQQMGGLSTKIKTIRPFFLKKTSDRKQMHYSQ